MKKLTALISVWILASASLSPGSPILRELWDNVADTTDGHLQGASSGATSFGFLSAAKWTVNPARPSATNALLVNGTVDAFDDYLRVYPILPASVFAQGTLSLAQPNTNGWDSATWATRFINTPNWINLNSAGVYYFSVRLVKRSFYYSNGGTNGYGTDDAAMGIGFSQGNSSGSFFVGAGFTRSVAGNESGGGGYLAADGVTDIGDSVYITSGTLGQAGLPGHPSDSGGPYYVRAYGYPQQVVGYISGAQYVAGGWLVGRLTATAGGNCTLDARAYVAADFVDTDPNTVSWDVSHNFNSTVTLNSLLVWAYGNNNFNPAFVDGIRVSTNWADVIGEEIIGAPSVSPTNTVYPGTPLTFTAHAYLSDENSWYQWLTNGVPDAGATGLGMNTYDLSDPTTAHSGLGISFVFSNGFSSGLVLTSAVQTITVLPLVPPILTYAPVSGQRYAGAASFSFSVVADGPRPFTYQWKQIFGNSTNILTGQTNASLVLTNLQPASAGTYLVTVGNPHGVTNSAPVTLGIINPVGFAEAVINNDAYAYWRLDETTNSPIVTNGTVSGLITNGTYVIMHDDWGGHDGVALDLTNLSLGIPGLAANGFPSNHRAVFIPNNSFLARINMPALPIYSNTMTFVCWAYTPTTPNAAGLLFNRDYSQAGGYGNAYGLEFVPYLTNFNTLGYQWGGFDQNPDAAFLGHTWTNSNLFLPQATWTFVTLVLSNNQATIYMGTNSGPLTVTTAALPAATDTSFPGTVYTNSFPLLIGRSGYPWAEVQGNAYNGANVQMSDVAIFYQALSPARVYKLYLAALSELITTTNSSGNLILSWPIGALYSSTNVAGPYTVVPGATSPYTVVNDQPQKFYRIQE